MLSTVTLPLIDLTLQLEFKTLDTLIPVWSHSRTKTPCILIPEEALAMYQQPGLRRKGRLYYPNPQIEICP